MKCPGCGKRNKDVVRTVEAGPVEVIRHRRCKGCGTWRTRELLIPRSYLRDTDGIPTERPQATGSTGVARKPSSPLVSVSSSSLSLVVDPPDQTPARQSKANAEVFPVVGDPDNPTWSITDDEDRVIRAAYPDLDVAQEYKRALAWVMGSKANRKTAGGMCRFLTGWMARNTNRGSARTNGVRGGHAPAVVNDRPSGEVKL